MGIKQINVDVTGQIGIAPRRVTLITSDSLATITTAGYLNAKNLLGYTISSTDEIVMWYDYVSAADPGTFAVFTASISASGVITLVEWANPGEVLMPVFNDHFATFSGTTGVIDDSGYSASDASKTKVVMASAAVIANHIACFSDTAGTINDDAATAINGGNLQAGLSGTAGTLASFPATAAKGSLKLVAVENTNDDITSISNAAMGQASVISIPDPASATANFILDKSAGTQTISSGNLAVSAGSITASGAVTSTAGALVSGLSTGGFVGKVQLFPTTTTTGSLTWQAVANGGNFSTIFQTAALGQATTYTVPDSATADAAVVVAPAALVNAKLVQASGTAGLVSDSGIATADVQLNTNIKAATTADIGGGGAGPISVVVAGLTAASVVVATIESSSNVVAVAKCDATATGFDITFTADPGAACLVNYVAFIAAQ